MFNSDKKSSSRRSPRRDETRSSSRRETKRSSREASARHEQGYRNDYQTSVSSAPHSFNRSSYGSGAKGSSVKYPAAMGGMNSNNIYSHSNSQQYILERKKERKKANRKKAALIALLVVAVMLLGTVGAAWAYIASIEGNLNDGVDDDLRDSLVVTDSPSDPFYMLLIGSDRSEERESSNEYGGAYRTDSMILARIDPQNKKVTLISIPRDTRVTIPGHGQQKINAAYAFGGPAGAVKAVSELAKVPISHYAEVDFEGFQAVVDALGGVDVNVPMTIDDPMAGGHVDAGEQTLNGEEALIFCRSRHNYDKVSDSGEKVRTANQRMVIAAIMKKVMSSDIATITNTVSTLANYVTTDMSVMSIIGVAQSMQGIDVENHVYTAACPTTSLYENDLWWEVLNEKEWATMMSRVEQGLSPTTEDKFDSGSGAQIASSGDGGDGSSSASSSSNDSSSNKDVSLKGTKIAVKNGAGISGCANEAANKLTPAGATVTTGNADDFNYKTTIVVYDNDSDKAKAQAIADMLGKGTVKKNGGKYSFTGDFLVVVGADWK